MKALTLWQPWATLVVHGYKTIETRSWSTNYRGPIAIHAAQRWDQELKELCLSEPFRSCLKEINPYRPFNLRLGGIIGTVGLYHILDTGWVFGDKEKIFVDHTKYDEVFGDYSEGRFAWLLTNPIQFEKMIPERGYQRLWNWSER